jgi:hypothetical protein
MLAVDYACDFHFYFWGEINLSFAYLVRVNAAKKAAAVRIGKAP